MRITDSESPVRPAPPERAPINMREKPMRTRLRLPALLAAMLALVLGLLAPTALAADRTVISENHTDAFYVVTTGGAPVVKVANGIRNTSYTPDDTVFAISPTTYSKENRLSGLSPEPIEGYYTGSWDADRYLEPGWSAPGFRENGFERMRIDFTAVTGPGRIAIVGNDPLGQDEHTTSPYLADGRYDVEPGASLPILGHTHAHWFLQRSGEYTIIGRAVGTRADGTESASQPFTVSFRVERNDADPRPSAPAPTTSPSAPTSARPAPSASASAPAAPSAPSTARPSERPTSSPSPGTGPVVSREKVEIRRGHVDLLNVIAHDGRLALTVKDDTGVSPVLRSPESVTVRVPGRTWTRLPARLHGRLLPAAYHLPSTGQNQDVAPFPGWDTNGVRPDFDAVDLELVDVRGPGRVLSFGTGLGGALTSPLASGSFDLRAGEVIHQAHPAHVHTNWLFEKPGTYTMTVRAASTSAGGKRVVSEPATYTWVVEEGGAADDSRAPATAPASRGASPATAAPAAPSAPTAPSAPSQAGTPEGLSTAATTNAVASAAGTASGAPANATASSTPTAAGAVAGATASAGERSSALARTGGAATPGVLAAADGAVGLGALGLLVRRRG